MVNREAEKQSAEDWRPVTGFEGSYEISRTGIVRSLARTAIGRIGRNGEPIRRRVHPKIKTPHIDHNGYQAVHLHGASETGRSPSYRVHRLMCVAFNGPPPFEGAICRHLNDDRLDNRPENLAWGTVADNTADARRNNRMAIGARVGGATLTEANVLEIRRRVGAGEKCLTIAIEYGVTDANVWRAAHGVSWKHLPGSLPRRRSAKNEATA